MDTTRLVARLAALLVALVAVGALGTLVLESIGRLDALVTVLLVVVIFGQGLVHGRRAAGERTPYW